MRRLATLVLVLLVGVPAQALAQEASFPPAGPRTFSLHLNTYPVGSYEASRELRLALWDSPMSKLEYAVAREVWAAQMGSLPGRGKPGSTAIRMSVSPGGPPRLVLAGPWSQAWHELSWQDQIAVTAQSAVAIGILAALAHNLSK
ncbi:MAG TPA: hypothetical protein P5234_03100 [Thermoanaerobaculaceae bacterium]|nr:hypothetical protein [Thermoanaerobaculaceae bacterium]HRS15217.1 hypothetical protein [Thermoanaerobaculaceae bacterium]